MSFLRDAHNVVINTRDFQYIGNTPSNNRLEGIDILYEASTPEAAFDAQERSYTPLCFPGTRDQYIDDITEWAAEGSSDNAQPIYWMKGPPGVGKSAIAQTCAARVKDAGQLGGAFFFSTNGRRTDHTRFFPTLAYQLSTIYHDYREIVDRKISMDRTLVIKAMRPQFQSLVVEPLQELESQGKKLQKRAIFVDGLDECESIDAQEEIIQIIASSVRTGSTPFRWAIFSREEPRIVSTFADPNISSLCHSVFLPISRKVDEEIELYLRDGFKNILRRREPLSPPSSWPAEKDIQRLVDAAAGLFAHSASILHFIDRHSYPGFKESLEIVLASLVEPGVKTGNESASPYAELDRRYTLTLQRVPGDILPTTLLFLSHVVLFELYNKSWSIASVCNILGISEAVFQSIRYYLHTVVIIQDPPQLAVDKAITLERSYFDRDLPEPSFSLSDQLKGVHGTVKLYHKSFYDFLNNPDRSSTFCVTTPIAREKLFDRYVQQCVHYASGYIIQGSRLVLAPGVADSSVSLSWPEGREFVDSFLQLSAFLVTSLLLSHDHPHFCQFLNDVPSSSMQKLAELDYRKSLIANRMNHSLGPWANVGVPGYAHHGTTKATDDSVFVYINKDEYDSFDPTAFLGIVDKLEKAGIIRPYHPRLGTNRAASLLRTFSRQKPRGRSHGRYKMGHGDKSVIWYWEFDTEEQYFHEFRTVNLSKAMAYYKAGKFKIEAQTDPVRPLDPVNLEEVDRVLEEPKTNIGQTLSDILLEMLSDILSNPNQRQDLCKLTGDRAQVVIDYLYSVLTQSVLLDTWMRRHCLAALSDVCRASQKYPHCYVLRKSISIGSMESLSAYSGIHRGRLGEKQLYLKMVRFPDTNTLSKVSMEAISWRHLNHPNVVPFYGIYHLDEMRQQLCLVSPWMQNGNLVDYLARHESASRLVFAYDVVSGLEYLQDSGIIHGDLKGTNILVNDDLRACITDFGLSSVQTGTPVELDNTTVHEFSVRWAAPELLKDDGDDVKQTFASDIWALGCVFYEILTRNTPFHELRQNYSVIGALLRGKTPTRPDTTLNPTEEIVWGLTDRCWLLEPAERPKCQEIRLALESAGLLRESVDTEDDTEHERRQLREAMGLGREYSLDLNEVKHTLEDLRSVEDEYTAAATYQEAAPNTDLHLETLCNVLQTQELRHALCNLQDNRAQVMIDYLYAVLSQPRLPRPWLRRHCLIILYKLSSASLRYPRSCMLEGVDILGASHEVAGGFSEVYTTHNSTICLKVAHPDTKDAKYTLKLYAKEAILWSQLRHPNIVPFYGVCYRDDIRQKVYLVSPWMRHGDLGCFLKTNISTPRAPLAYGIVAGLDYLHALGIIHGNLKESNVLVNDFMEACITDFRTSFVYTDTTLATSIMSRETHEYSFRWTAPELLEDDSLPTFVSDIWALGCILNQVMTGNVPFPGLSEIQVMAALMRKERPWRPVSTSDSAEKVVWKEIDRCFAIEAWERPKAHDILSQLRLAGLSHGNDPEAQNDNERKNEVSLRHAHRGPAGPLGLVDLEEVDRAFEELKKYAGQAHRDLLLEMLSDILSNPEQRQDLYKMTGNMAQVIVDYLYSVLMQPVLPDTWIHRYCLVALSEVCGTSQRFPHCYVLNKTIEIGPIEGKMAYPYVHKGELKEKQLCLKMIYSPDTNTLSKISMEAISWRHLNHPNVAPFYGIYHLDETRRQLCLVSPWMQNANLVDYLTRHESAPRPPFVYDVVSGLEYLQDSGIIHGDLRAVNIFVNDYHKACIADFGLSSFVAPVGLNTTTEHGYALRWAAPELLGDDDVRKTFASDTWALGCVFYEILTGKVPFHEFVEDAHVISALLSGKIPTREDMISSPIEEVIWNVVIDYCWLMDPTERADCHEIRLTLESGGVSRGGDNTEDSVEHQEQRSQEVADLGEQYPLDLNEVKNILISLNN